MPKGLSYTDTSASPRLAMPPTSSVNRRSVAAAVVAVTAIEPFPIVLARFRGQPVFLFDVGLLAACVLGAVAVRRRAPESALAIVGASFLALFATAAITHPSLAGGILVVRVTGAVALAACVASMPRQGARWFTMAFVSAAAVETAIALGQWVHRGPVGLSWLGEFQYPLYKIGAVAPPRGTFIHPYPLAGFCLVAAAAGAIAAVRARRPGLWLVLAGCAVVPAGLSLSRMALAGAVVLVCGLFAAGRADARYVWGAIAVGACFVGGAGLAHSGWSTRLHTATTARTAEQFTTGRVHLTDQAVHIVVHHPVIGVGPARYASLGDEVNDVPLLVAAEAGIATALALVALLALIAARAVRSGGAAVGLFGAYLPFILLDRFPYGTAQGLALSGVWAGAVLLCARVSVEVGAVRRIPPTAVARPG
jgi:O-antigen ligase/polysaccharide polymerase Wzy-like membrane protein